ncbi:gamma-glutamylcyclotransferase family protein [Nocardia higoensis]|uniref:gamma-glutamylcyclotransferase family protein n=1 Tax=Nocardia higoensis TaxID=228599 RepID=UPI00031E0A94|nr:gamma-glutamylcyclotransferase family protein [Nocardia higoensis]
MHDRRDARTTPLFAYGTLRVDAVLRTLLGRIPDSTPDVLTGWRIARLPDRVYPGLVPAPAGSATGRLLTGLAAAEWTLLDRYEGDEYDLVPVTLASGTAAMVYVWNESAEGTEWLLDDFIATELSPYVERCASWLRHDRAGRRRADQGVRGGDGGI